MTHLNLRDFARPNLRKWRYSQKVDMTLRWIWVANNLKMSRTLAYVGCFFVAGAVGCMILAFASPYWVESFGEFVGNRFVKAGLWEFCFNDYTFYKDHNGKRYMGCFYIFSDVIRPLWEWLSPRKYLFIPLVLVELNRIRNPPRPSNANCGYRCKRLNGPP